MTCNAVRALIHRPINAAHDEKYIVEKAHSGMRSIPVYGILCADGVGNLVRIEDRFDPEKYIDTLYTNVMPIIKDKFTDGNFYYYQEKSPIHRAQCSTVF